jgi:hypothetical protein
MIMKRGAALYPHKIMGIEKSLGLVGMVGDSYNT